jgi:hypothetical protein
MQAGDGTFELSDPGLRVSTATESAFRWARVTIEDRHGTPAGEINLREPFSVLIEGEASRRIDDLELNFSLYSGTGVNMFNSSQTDTALPTSFDPGPMAVRISFDPNLLAPGQYTLGLWATAPTARDHIRLAAHFSVSLVDAVGGSLPANYAGIIVYPCGWELVAGGRGTGETCHESIGAKSDG